MSLIYLSLCSIIINERWGEVYWREGGGKGGQSGPRKFTGEVYWGSLPGNKAPVDFLGLDGGGGVGKGRGRGGGGNPRHHISPGSMVADVCWPPARHHISVKTSVVMI